MIALHLALKMKRKEGHEIVPKHVAGLLLIAPAINLLGSKLEAWKEELLNDKQKEDFAQGKTVMVDMPYGPFPFKQSFIDGYK